VIDETWALLFDMGFRRGFFWEQELRSRRSSLTTIAVRYRTNLSGRSGAKLRNELELVGFAFGITFVVQGLAKTGDHDKEFYKGNFSDATKGQNQLDC
jgi:hypothetical protein